MELNQLFLPVINLLHYFPRASQEARVLQEQLAILKEQIIESIAVFNTLFAIAQAKENKENLPVYRLLEDQLKLQVRPYVDFFEYRKGIPSGEENNNKKELNENR